LQANLTMEDRRKERSN